MEGWNSAFDPRSLKNRLPDHLGLGLDPGRYIEAIPPIGLLFHRRLSICRISFDADLFIGTSQMNFYIVFNVFVGVKNSTFVFKKHIGKLHYINAHRAKF